jgi:hypothetical protein
MSDKTVPLALWALWNYSFYAITEHALLLAAATMCAMASTCYWAFDR